MKAEQYIGSGFQVIEDPAGDVVIATPSRAGEEVVVPRYPLAWLTPRRYLGGLRLGAGLALMSGTDVGGTVLTGSDPLRAVLREPYTVDWVDDPGTRLYAASVTPGTPEVVAKGVTTPSEWTAVNASYDTTSTTATDGVRCLVLGAVSGGRLAIAEKVKYTGGGPDVYEAKRFPWRPILEPATLPGYTLAEIAGFYFTETEITEDTDL